MIWLPSNLRFGFCRYEYTTCVLHRNPVLSLFLIYFSMNSYPKSPEPVSHGDLLADCLRRLDSDPTNQDQDRPQQVPPSFLPSRAPDGYGFRPPSGVSTPAAPPDRNSPLPDVNGLGWPGQSSFSSLLCHSSLRHHHSFLHSHKAKSTLSRLHASPAEKLARQTRLTAAVRTVLECIGEDPDREGLLRTPERYAQALMWMTRGYEERLAGIIILSPPFSFSCPLPLQQFTSPKTNKAAMQT
jgi:GTP cyclohydrolase I